MARPIVMPGMSMYAAEGTVAEWLKPRGTMVEAGEPILAMTTDKAAYEIEAPVAGILHPIAPEGVSLPVEAILGYILAPGEDPPALPVESAQPGPASEECSTASPISIIQASADTAPPLIANRPSTEVRASPRARRLAVEHGIDLD
ncbi:MAG TPA: biotin/lipoyl-containing protein, partial [Anaerolineales bacterium]|nr:biotin/lipoyl-containing protein [Anaerolineales bacterium]